MSSDHIHLVNNGKRDLTLDELARMQPGMDRLMAEVGPRVHRMYYAAKAGNWPLAAYFSKSVVKQLQLKLAKFNKKLPRQQELRCAQKRSHRRTARAAAEEGGAFAKYHLAGAAARGPGTA